MAHFCVLVVGTDPETSLAPFNNGSMSEPPEDSLEFSVFVVAGDEQKVKDSELALPIWQRPENLVRYNEYLAMTPEEFCASRWGYMKNSEGDWGYYDNPSGMFDWFVIGGRWADFFVLKPGARRIDALVALPGDSDLPDTLACCCYKGDVDVEAMRFQWIQKKRIHWEEYMAQIECNPDREDELRKIREIPKGSTFDDWLALDNNPFVVHSVVMDGEWYSDEELGMFGPCSENGNKPWNEEFKELWDSIPDNEQVTIIDCHC